MTSSARARTLAQWLALATLVGIVCGAASALFLTALDRCTHARESRPWLLYALPFAGLLMGAAYERLGAKVKGGNNLVIDTIHDDGPEIPLRMAPLVLLGTLLTHLFGGSAGREGTAVQMGASLTDWISHRLGLDRATRRRLLAAGVAGGFGSVFGTPIAGAIFGLEFVVLGRIEYDALIPALVASLVGDLTTRALGVGHTAFPSAPQLALTPLIALKWAAFSVAIAAASATFIELTHAIKKHSEARLRSLSLRMFAGGLAVVALTQLAGTTMYSGLGVATIVRAFTDPTLPSYAFALKLLFTAVTIGAGFLGGEVTPLFFVGATLGATLAKALGLPIALGAGVGMAALFGAAANAPIALALMAVELMGAHSLPHVLIVCVLSYALSGHRSIYPSQRLLRGKLGQDPTSSSTIRSLSSLSKDTISNRGSASE